jgi:RNA polymerase sigma-70 factor (ECF subfamily)
MSLSKKAFEKEVMDLLGKLHGVARRLTGNQADAEDLVAETVAKAWKCLDTLANEEAFKGWIFRILNNTFISDMRRASARPRLESIEDENGNEDEAEFSIFEQMHQPFLLWFSTPEQAFVDKLLREDLDRALCTLPDHYRVVVILSDLEEFSYSEIGETLDIPVGTVRSRLARARGALQKILWAQAQEYGLKQSNSPEHSCKQGNAGASSSGTEHSSTHDLKGSVK